MDINNIPYFLLREPAEFAQQSTHVTWNQRKKALVLAQNQDLRLPASDSVVALDEWSNAVPLVLDEYGQQARISASGHQIEYNAGRGFLPLVDGQLKPVIAPAGGFTDLSIACGVGADSRFAAAYSNDADEHGIVVFHLAKRWQLAVQIPEKPLRVVVDKRHKIWCITATLLLCCEGEPLPHDYIPRSDHFEPESLNPHPLQIVWQMPLTASDKPLALCADDEYLYVLFDIGSSRQTIFARSLEVGITESRRYTVSEDCPFSIDIAVASFNRLALMSPRQQGDSGFRNRDCPVVELRWDEQSMSGEALLIKERYPMLSQKVPRFVSSADGVLRYQGKVDKSSKVEDAGFSIQARELHPLKRPHYYSMGRATLREILDSGQPETVWHRLYLEGCIPPGCHIIVYARAFNNPDNRRHTPFIRQPDWVWCHHRSEQPFGKGLLETVPREQGLFEILLQRNAGPVRRLSGRYLQLRLCLTSKGRHTPSVHALKIYYPRFSYQEAYLPEHFRQELNVDPVHDDQPANGADVRERMLASFEASWTPLEGKIASSEVLLSPEYTPQAHLPWLAELLGQATPDHWSVARKRRWLAATGVIQQWRGTLAGLNLVLDIITDGAVARGQVVLVENFRMRRTMATILGLNTDDEDHPLTLGTGMSGNSIVGDSLILAEEDAREFLALFAPEVGNKRDKEMLEDFFDHYANQVTVLLHGAARKLGNVVTAALEEQMPAHLEWRILETDHPFVLGLAPLLAVDTYLEKRPQPRRATLDDTWLGQEGVLKNPAAFSPKDVNAHI